MSLTDPTPAALAERLTAREYRRRRVELRAWAPANVSHLQVTLQWAQFAGDTDEVTRALVEIGTAMAWVDDERELLEAENRGTVPDPLVQLGALVRGARHKALYGELVAAVRVRAPRHGG